MAEYIERAAAIDAVKKERNYTGKFTFEEEHAWAVGFQQGITFALSDVAAIPAADVLPRDEGIKLGAELAAMHGATPEQQQLEEAFLKGVEHGMTRRDVRLVVRGEWEEDCAGAAICSVCGEYAFETSRHHLCGWFPNFCPNCGAEMRGEQDV